MFELTEEDKAMMIYWFKEPMLVFEGDTLQALRVVLRKLKAAAMEARFSVEHRDCGYSAPMSTTYGGPECFDPRHFYRESDWLRDAEKELIRR